MRKLRPTDYKGTCRHAARVSPANPTPARTRRDSEARRDNWQTQRPIPVRSRRRGAGPRTCAGGGRARAGFSARARAGLAAPECAACGGGAAAIRRRTRAAWRGGLLHSGLLSPRAVFPELPRCRRWGDFPPDSCATCCGSERPFSALPLEDPGARRKQKAVLLLRGGVGSSRP